MLPISLLSTLFSNSTNFFTASEKLHREGIASTHPSTVPPTALPIPHWGVGGKKCVPTLVYSWTKKMVGPLWLSVKSMQNGFTVHLNDTSFIFSVVVRYSYLSPPSLMRFMCKTTAHISHINDQEKQPIFWCEMMKDVTTAFKKSVSGWMTKST